jgi:hypothetical protein
MACEKCDRGQGVVEEGREEREESLAVGVGVCVGFVEDEAL